MKNPLKLGLVFVLLWSIVAVVVSPAVDLQPTALRAAKFASMIFAIGSLVAAIVFEHLLAEFWMFPAEQCQRELPPSDFIDLDCTRLC